MLVLAIFNHQFISEIVVAEAMHVRDALADEFVGLGFVEEREGIFQRHVGHVSRLCQAKLLIFLQTTAISMLKLAF